MPAHYAYADDGDASAPAVVYQVVDDVVDGYAIAQTVAEYESLGKIDPAVDRETLHAIADQKDADYRSGPGVLIFEQDADGSIATDHVLAVLDSGHQVRLYSEELVAFLEQETSGQYLGVPIDYLQFDASYEDISILQSGTTAPGNASSGPSSISNIEDLEEFMDDYQKTKEEQDFWGKMTILSTLGIGISAQVVYRLAGIAGKKKDR